MAISKIVTNSVDSGVTLTSPVMNTITSAAATALTLQSAGTTAVTINTSQYVTYANNPAFSASLNGSTQSVTSGSTVTLTFGTVNHNRGSAYNGSTYIFTAPVAGMYQFNARARVDGIAGSAQYAILILNTTGQTYNSICSATGSYNNLNLSVSTYMAAGHTAYVALNSSGQTVYAVNTQPVYSDFSGFLIG